MADLSKFIPRSANDLTTTIIAELKGEATKWWDKNKNLMEGYIKSLAEAAIQTQAALADGRITKKTADVLTHMQELNFNQTIQFTKLMTLALAQRLVDAAFRVIGWALFNSTGVNVMPHLVKPTP